MMGEQKSTDSGLSLDHWFASRSRSWAGSNRRPMALAWVLVGLIVICSLGLIWIAQTSDSATDTITAGFVVVIAGVLSFGLLIQYFVLAMSKVAWCLPRTEMIGGLSDREYMWQVQRGSFMLALKLALLLLLPQALLGVAARSVFAASLGSTVTGQAWCEAVDSLLCMLLYAFFASFLELYMTRIAIGLRVALAIVFVLLGDGLAALSVLLLMFVAGMSGSGLAIELPLLQQLLEICMKLLLILVVLLAARRPAEEFIEQLSEGGHGG